MSAEHTALLALSSMKGVGYWTLFNIGRAGLPYSEILSIEKSEEAAAAVRKFGGRLDLTAEWQEQREQGLKRASEIAREMNRQDSQLILKSDPHYPPQLLELPDAPQWIFVQGDASVLRMPCITAVGTRTPTEDGLFLAEYVGANLGIWGAPTVSGLASGIDQVIHRWSLRMRVPTVAVLGNGLALNFPKGSGELRADIVKNGGAIVTEYFVQDSYSAENFVRRNRLQAALGRVLIPVEWALKSGTSHTIRFAMNLRRPVAMLQLPRSVGSADISRVNGAHLFLIPGEEDELRHFVSSALAKSISQQAFQPDMFE